MAKTPKLETKPEVKAVGDVNELFTAEELKALADEADAEHLAEKKADAAAAFKEERKRKARKAEQFKNGTDAKGEDVESVQINLAPHSPFINIDGRLFYHGLTYKFTQAQAQTIKSAMFETWRHEKEVGGANMNSERGYKPVNQTLSGAI